MTINGNVSTIAWPTSAAPPGRVLEVASAGDLTLNDATVEHGAAGDPSGNAPGCCGGVILNHGTLGLNRVTVSDGTAEAGGDIWSDGSATLNASTVTGGTTWSDPGGGGILSSGFLHLIGSTVSGNGSNDATGGNGGAGILGWGTVVLDSNTLIDDNTNSGFGAGMPGGGVLLQSGTLTATDTTISNNSATDSGGGVYAAGSVSFTRVTLSGNIASNAGNPHIVASGGGLYAAGGLSYQGGSVTGNHASADGGGIYQPCPHSGISGVSFSNNFPNNVGPKCVPAAPSITGLCPASGPITGGTLVAIHGLRFTNATAVLFGSRAALTFRVQSSSLINAVSPPGFGMQNVRVRTAGGLSPLVPDDRFTYGLLPTLPCT
jgi:predicted outer membrane repeat protein